jgi:hypothetical protein
MSFDHLPEQIAGIVCWLIIVWLYRWIRKDR